MLWQWRIYGGITLKYHRPHHQKIYQALSNFNSNYLRENQILFGGGTRIALELEEFRESVDMDFICPTIESYRAVRSKISQGHLGNLVFSEFNYIREIRADRYAVRTVINIDETPIKLEFVSMESYRLSASEEKLFPVPYIDRESCFITKLLAHADRPDTPNRKDLLDLLMMHSAWGEVSKNAWKEAERHYGSDPYNKLIERLDEATQTRDFFSQINVRYRLQINEKHIERIQNEAAIWFNHLKDCS